MNKKIQQVINTLNKINFHNNDQISQQHLDMIENTASINDLYNKLTTEITEHNISKEGAANVLYKGFLQTENPNYLYKAAKLSNEFAFPALVTSSLIKINQNQSSSFKYSIQDDLNYQNVFEFFRNFEITEEVVNLFSDIMPHDLLEAYRSDLVNQQINNKKDSSNILADNIYSGWYSNKVHVRYSEVTEIGNHPEGGKLYGLIDESYQGFEGKNWQFAMSMGYSSASQGRTGVKILKNKAGENSLYEVKVPKCDARLVTNFEYKNDQGNKLVIFNTSTRNHAETKKAAKDIGIHSFECDAYYEPDTGDIDVTGEVFADGF